MTDIHATSQYYRGPATVDGYAADAVLSVSHQIMSDGPHSATSGPTIWSGALIILDSRADPNVLELGGSVEIVIGDSSSRARVIHTTPGSSALFVQAEGRPPFDLSAP